MNNYDMEANSRPELLASFKRAYGESMRNICRLLEKFCPEMTVEDIQNFIYIFFPLVMGNEFVGVVEKTGAAVKEFSAGDRVYGRMPSRYSHT